MENELSEKPLVPVFNIELWGETGPKKQLAKRVFPLAILEFLQSALETYWLWEGQCQQKLVSLLTSAWRKTNIFIVLFSKDHR